MNAGRDIVVRLTPDPSALLEFLDTAAGALITASHTLRAAYPESEPSDRTGLCDHCDKPQTGGAAGGGISPEHWCADHDPTREPDFVWPQYTDGGSSDVDAVWIPATGDRVVIHCEHPVTAIPAGTVAVVLEVGQLDGADTPVWVAVHNGRDDVQGWRVPLYELRPLADEPGPDVPPLPLLLEVARAHSAWIDAAEDYRPLAETVVGVVRERLSKYQGSTPVSQVFAEWFPEDGAV